MRRNREYKFNTPVEEQNREFYEAYDPYFLRNKARSLMIIADNPEGFKALIEEESDFRPEEVNQKFIDAMRTEVHFTAFHQFECLFALMGALYQDLPHWLYLSTYGNDEIRQKISAFLEGDIERVTNGHQNDVRGFIQQAIYSELLPNGYQERWNENLDTCLWLLQTMAEKFRILPGNEYNAYKHGLRVRAGGTTISFSALDEAMQPVQAPNASVEYHSDDAISYLEIDDENRVLRVNKHFNAYESMVYLEEMSQFLFTIVNTRMARMTGSTNTSLCLFLDINREELLKLRRPMLRFRITM